MGGKLTGSTEKFALSVASQVATQFLDEMLEAGAMEQGLVCGSVRRGCDPVGDIDLVVMGNEKTEDWLKKQFGLAKNGKAKRSGLFNGIQVDVLIATPESWGAACMHFTGSMRMNIVQRSRAKSMGLLLNEKGLFDADGKYVAGRTEQEVYEALELDWLRPAVR